MTEGLWEEVDGTEGVSVSAIETEKLEDVYERVLSSSRGLGSDPSRRKRGIELWAELLERQTKSKLERIQVDQRKWRDDLKRRSRQRQRMAKKEAKAKNLYPNGTSGHGVELGTKNRPCNKKVGWSLQKDIPESTGKEWRKYEQDKLRKILLTYGMGEWGRIQKQLLEEHTQLVHGVHDIRNLTYTLLVALKESQDQLREAKLKKEKEKQEKEGEDGEGATGEGKKGAGAARPGPVPKEDAFAIRKISEYKEEGAIAIPELSNPWPKIDKLGLSWLRKLRLMDLINEAALMGMDESKIEQFEDLMATMADSSPPIEWWSTAADKALLFGVYKHGYGAFDKIRNDPEYAEAFTRDETNVEANLKKREQFRHKEGCQCVSCVHTRKKREKEEQDAKNGSAEGKEPVEESKADDDWPNTDGLTKRLKKVTTALESQKKRLERERGRAERDKQRKLNQKREEDAKRKRDEQTSRAPRRKRQMSTRRNPVEDPAESEIDEWESPADV
ncbi:hypothetical protein HOP50_05g36000 [Chloropicon primus]|uniref:Uncharacterized protein n=3 Tax=Chloropicon primus TaxID=1764295 RepID=A0A5B8MM22_9CHLO|nr:hypothetical protein A3770_05p35920 [Chloropicon primus]UPR00286.1 hypothetical protein HOP50_05g36000 [Chloropicon primus]|eukprot:QDZ21074.1 hypothetical protein A3770_05p35920 [Chloropicon primus]